MENPLVALGLVETRSQIVQMMQPFDKDGSGKIDYNEFLGIIKGGAGSNQDMTNFFKKITRGDLAKQAKYLDFSTVVSQYRR